MSQSVIKFIKTILFIMLALGILVTCNIILKPAWDSNSYNPDEDIYAEPVDTIETVFIGSSHVHNAISPMKLYEDYGICSYSFTTNSQPILASYYWPKEIYNRQSATLDSLETKHPGFYR